MAAVVEKWGLRGRNRYVTCQYPQGRCEPLDRTQTNSKTQMFPLSLQWMATLRILTVYRLRNKQSRESSVSERKSRTSSVVRWSKWGQIWTESGTWVNAAALCKREKRQIHFPEQAEHRQRTKWHPGSWTSPRMMWGLHQFLWRYVRQEGAKGCRLYWLCASDNHIVVRVEVE
jgi:hypothetical protein